jgi:peptidoglycan/xylan/chitin deacetylase (PgdA/CDA1 family)
MIFKRIAKSLHWRLIRPLRSRLWPGALVVGYHRIADLYSDPHRLAVSPERFDQHMAILSRICQPLPLVRLAQNLRESFLPKRAVAVTFDDGYRDNLVHAKPILQRHGVPATVFVASGYTRSGKEFWWDELAKLVCDGRLDVGSVQISWQGRPQSWQVETAPQRNEAHLQIHRLMLFAREEERIDLLTQLRPQLGPGAAPPSHSFPMTEQDLCDLVGGGLVDVGAHTVTHPNLASLTPETQKHEILQSRQDLEQILGKPVSVFAYPYGWPTTNFTDETPTIVAQAGFACACTICPGIIRTNTDAYRLPRFMVGNWEAGEFEHHLRDWLRG